MFAIIRKTSMPDLLGKTAPLLADIAFKCRPSLCQGHLAFIVQACIFDGYCNLVGQGGKNGDILLGKCIFFPALNIQDANDLPTDRGGGEPSRSVSREVGIIEVNRIRPTSRAMRGSLWEAA